MQDDGKFSVPPCVSGLISNIKALQRLWHSLSALGIKQMNLRRFNSDHVGIFFSLVRQSNGSNRTPSCKQFISAYKSSLLVSSSTRGGIHHPNSNNDGAQFLKLSRFDGDVPLYNGILIPTPRCSIIRGNSTYFDKLHCFSYEKSFRQGPTLLCNGIAVNARIFCFL